MFLRVFSFSQAHSMLLPCAALTYTPTTSLSLFGGSHLNSLVSSFQYQNSPFLTTRIQPVNTLLSPLKLLRYHISPALSYPNSQSGTGSCLSSPSCAYCTFLVRASWRASSSTVFFNAAGLASSSLDFFFFFDAGAGLVSSSLNFFFFLHVWCIFCYYTTLRNAWS